MDDIMKSAIGRYLGDFDGIPSISIGTTISEAIHVMRTERAISMVVTQKDGTLCGIISEHDVVSALSAHGKDALDLAIDKFITMDLVCCSANQTVFEVLGTMSEFKIRHIPIVNDDGHLEAFLSVLDVLGLVHRSV